MKKLRVTFVFLCLSLLVACNRTATDNGNVRASQTTNNQIAVANLRLGAAYMREGNFEKSLVKLNKALDADPEYYATLNVLGVLHQRMGENAEAEKYFKRSLQKSPDEPTTLNNYGQFLCSTDRLEEAEQAFNKAANNPLYESPEIANANAGTCAMRNQRYEDAEQYFRKALEQNPNVPSALIQMAEINVLQENFLSARAYIQRYSQIRNHTAKSLWIGIQTEKQLGDKDTLASYALLLKNNFPDSEEAKLLLQSGIL